MGNIVLKVNKTHDKALASWFVTTPGPINPAQRAAIDALDFNELHDGQQITFRTDGKVLPPPPEPTPVMKGGYPRPFWCK